MSARASNAANSETELNEAEPAHRSNTGQFQAGVSGNPQGSHVTKGIVDYIKGRTDNYKDLISMLLDVTFGVKLPDTDNKPWAYTMQQRLDCLNSVLDRSIGKPTQTIIETGDDTAKEVLVAMQKLLDKKDGGPAPEALQGADSDANPILVMKERKHG